MLTGSDGTQRHLKSPLGIYGFLLFPLGIMASYLGTEAPMDENHVRKMQLAVTVLLEEPDELHSALETELRLFRDKLHVLALEYAIR